MTKKDTIAEWKAKLATDSRWALRALVRIYQEQTPSEKDIELTMYHNNVGFSGVDADILTSFVKQYQRRGELSPKQMMILHQRIPKYAGQLYRLTQPSKKAVAV